MAAVNAPADRVSALWRESAIDGIELAAYNSAPAMIVYRDDQPDTVFTVEMIDDKITNFYAIRNPDKLASVTVRRENSR